MKRLLFAATAIFISASSAFAQTGAPFCAVSASGRDCLYYTLPDCERAASVSRGACVANGSFAAPSVQPSPPQPSFSDRFQQGFERSRSQRGVVTSDGPAPDLAPAPARADDMDVALRICTALRTRFMQETDYERARPHIESFQICMAEVEAARR